MPVVAAELNCSLDVLSPVVLLTQCERSQVESGGPALTAVDQPCHGRQAQVRAGRAQEELRLVRAQCEAVDPDLRQLATAAQGGDRELRRRAAGKHEQRAFGTVLRDRQHCVESFARAEQVRIVEDEHDGLVEFGEGRPEPRNRRRPDGSARSCEGLEDAGLRAARSREAPGQRV